MAIDAGLIQFLDWGTASSITTSVGKVTGGTIVGDSAAVHREAIGVQDKIVGGMIPYGGDASIMVDNFDLLTYALRSGYTDPSLTDLTFAGGVMGDARQQTGCKINTLELSCAIGEPLTANIGWLGTADAAYATAAKSYLTDTVFEWFMGVVTLNSASVQCQGFTLNINNNLEHIATLDSSSSGTMRDPDAIRIGSQEVSLSMDILTRPTSKIGRAHV